MKDKNDKGNSLKKSTILILMNALTCCLFAVYFIVYCYIFSSEFVFTDYSTSQYAGMMVSLAFTLLRWQGLFILLSLAIYYISEIAGAVTEGNRLLERDGHFDDIATDEKKERTYGKNK